MSTTIGTNSSLLLNYTRAGQSVLNTQPSLAQLMAEDQAADTQLPASTSVTLSAEAKAYLARSAASTQAGDATASAARATTARQWFDQQYQALGISSALLDGKVAVDLTGQSRATLSAVASNAQGLFSKDESTAATLALRARFEAALAPHAVIARHNGDYAGLYDAALSYANEAGPDERATQLWQTQTQALLDGAIAARKTPGKAPDTENASDPVQALLTGTTAATSITAQTGIKEVADRARALLDAQKEAARDKGTTLTFDASDKRGQAVDFSGFDNRSLAAIAINQEASFSADEARAAKAALGQRHRDSVLSALKSTAGGMTGSSANFDLLNRYSSMSAEEKAALGVSDGFTSQLVKTYQSIQSTQNKLGGNGLSGLLGYL